MSTQPLPFPAEARSVLWDLSGDSLGAMTPDGRLLAINAAGRERFGWNQSTFCGPLPEAVLHPDDVSSAMTSILQGWGSGIFDAFTCRVADVEGHYHSIEWLGKASPDEGVIYFLWRDAQPILNPDLETHAMNTAYLGGIVRADGMTLPLQIDLLTGLTNRVGLCREIVRAFDRRAYGEQQFSVMLLDLDRFKHVNDAFGHAAGDHLLREVSERIRAHVRDQDIVARLDGDEFAILYRIAPNQREHSIVVATRLVDKISEPYMIDGRPVMIGASIGIAIAPDHGSNVDELMRNATSALFQVKGQGHGGYHIFDAELDRSLRARRALEEELRGALERDEFRLVYHPIISLETRQVEVVEALLRWEHPTKGFIPNDVYIPLAEETGLITMIGEWVIGRACRDAAQMPASIRVAINVSAVQLRNRSILDAIASALLTHKLQPQRLEIEVTETVLLDINKLLLPDLHQLQAIGVKIALDDFGTGYSSLSYLRAFPFDKIKIDKSFVADLGLREDCTAIVCAVISLARSLNVTCTAEGIEHEEQIVMLRAAGCHQGQGYFYSRPISLDKLLNWLAEWKQIHTDSDRATA